MLLLMRAARKMFPKRRLVEGRSEKAEGEAAEEETGQQNKRPRVESSASSAGMGSPLQPLTAGVSSGRMLC